MHADLMAVTHDTSIGWLEQYMDKHDICMTIYLMAVTHDTSNGWLEQYMYKHGICMMIYLMAVTHDTLVVFASFPCQDLCIVCQCRASHLTLVFACWPKVYDGCQST